MTRSTSPYLNPEPPTSEGKVGLGARALFVATIGTTFYAGMLQSPSYGRWSGARSFMGFDFEQSLPPWWHVPSIWGESLLFSLSLLGILFAHEMGHYLTARRRNVEVSFPTFIPSIPPFGTLGAFIRMSQEKMPVRSLMAIAAWGPFAGMIVAVPVLLLGLSLSEVKPLPVHPDAVMSLGSCGLMWGMEQLFFPNVPEGYDIFLHPVAFAGWAGCFVTALNLLPMGQLDGGHVIYALEGDRSERLARGTWLLLVVAGWWYAGWLLFALLVRFVIGLRHPALSVDGTAEGGSRWMGYAAVALFFLTFSPAPVKGSGLRDALPDLLAWVDVAFGWGIGA